MLTKTIRNFVNGVSDYGKLSSIANIHDSSTSLNPDIELNLALKSKKQMPWPQTEKYLGPAYIHFL